MKDHWNHIYRSSNTTSLGWYEELPVPSLQLLEHCDVDKEDLILDVGSGASTFIDTLLERGYRNIIATDISEVALEKSRERLGPERAALVRWVVEDITHPVQIASLTDVAMWHDRAVLHFLLAASERQAYRTTLRHALKQGGYAIIAAFSLKGARRCSGLEVKRYDETLLADFLGEEFERVDAFDYTYHMPSGEPRPYIYTLFRKTR